MPRPPARTSARRTADRNAHQPAVHDPTRLHHLLDRRRQPPRQDLHQPAGGRQRGANGHRPQQQPDAPRAASTSANCRARPPAWRSSTGRPGPGAISARPRSCSATGRPAKLEEQPDFGTLALALLEPQERRPGRWPPCRKEDLPEMLPGRRPAARRMRSRPVGEKLVGALAQAVAGPGPGGDA